jgi:cell division protein FtsI (penicillin-binding protein 3)
MNDSKDIVWRVRLIFAGVVVFALFILGRAFSVGVINRDYWLAKKEHQTIRFRTIEAARGNVYSSDGSLLATSLPIYDMRMDLKAEYLDKIFDDQVDSLALMMSKTFRDKSTADYEASLKRARRAGDRYFLLQKDVKHDVMGRMKKFPILRYGRFRGGLIVETKTRREMPFRHLALRTLGSYKEGVKSLGIEGSYNGYLKGIEGKQLVQKMSGGVWRPLNAENEVDPKEGNDIVSTIDIAIQDVAEAELQKQLRKNQAANGCVILMEVETGYIRAIANLGRIRDTTYSENYNYAIGNGTEPGSTFKLASLMALFEDGLAKPEDIYDTKGGKVVIAGRTIKDSHEGGYGKISLAEAFKVSSNTAIAQAVYYAYQKTPGKFVERLKKFHLANSLGLDIQGESIPVINNPLTSGSPGSTLLSLAIGYEALLAPIQTLAFYNAVANNGRYMKPQFVEEIRHRGQLVKRFEPVVLAESICSKTTIDRVKPMLESVVEAGTAKNLKNDFFKIGGKTGTARIAQGKSGYEGSDGKVKYQASFVGYFPADNPKYTCIVVVNAPSASGYYGNIVAGPVFKGVADKVYARNIEIQNVEPKQIFNDNLAAQTRCANSSDLAIIMKQSGKPMSLLGEDNWLQISQEARAVKTTRRRIDSSVVPDVRGMGLKDAMYILENRGVRVRVNGRGQVKFQSIPAGQRIQDNMEILLELT